MVAAGFSACAHSMIVTSDPPGQAVYMNGELVGQTPVAVEEAEPFATHLVTLGQGADAVTQVVLANKVLAKDELSAVLMPLSCLCIFPLYWTAGTDDRVHIAKSISGQPIGGTLDSDLELEYLEPDASYPSNVRVERQVVDGKEIRVMTDRRPFITTLHYQGIAYPTRPIKVFPEKVVAGKTSISEDRIGTPTLSVGAEQEWYPLARFGLGLGLTYSSLEKAIFRGQAVPVRESVENENRLRYVEWRVGPLVRYRHPLLHWDGVSGGLDGTLSAGGDIVLHNYYYTGKQPLSKSGLVPWVEAGLDIAITRAVSAFISDRFYPLAVDEPGSVWGNLGAIPEQRLILGARLFW